MPWKTLWLREPVPRLTLEALWPRPENPVQQPKTVMHCLPASHHIIPVLYGVDLMITRHNPAVRPLIQRKSGKRLWAASTKIWNIRISQNDPGSLQPRSAKNPENLQSPVSVMRIHAAVRSIPNILLKVHSLPNIVTIISLQISAMLPVSLPVVTARQIPFPPEYSSLAERLEQRILHIFWRMILRIIPVQCTTKEIPPTRELLLSPQFQV